MKLVTCADGSRDGQLAVVDTELVQAHYATGTATRLQQVMDDWNFLSPQLEDLSATLGGGKARHAWPFDPAACLAPLPRPPRCVVASPGDGRAVAVREAPAWFGSPVTRWPLPQGDRVVHWFPHLAVLTGDLPQGVAATRAGDGVRLLAFGVQVVVSAPPAAPDDGCSTAAVAPPSSGRWLFAPAALTPDAWPVGGGAPTWQLDGAGPRTLRAAATDWPEPGGRAVAAALAAAAAAAPMPAGGVLLWPLALDPSLQAAPLLPGRTLRLRLLAPGGGEAFGPVACEGVDAAC